MFSLLICAVSSVAAPGPKSTYCSSSPPPNIAPRSENGDVAAFSRMFAMAFQTSPPMLNFGSSRLPLTGKLRSILPLRSLSRATASFTGSFVALVLSLRGPNVNWSMAMAFAASSFRFSIL